MATIGSLVANLGLNTANFSAGIKKSQKAMTRFVRRSKRQFNELNKSAGRVGETMLTVATVGFGAMVKNAIDSADHMEKLNRRLGVSTEALSQLKFAAEQSGVQFNTLTMGMQRAQRRIAEAAKGTGEAKEALIELGLSASALSQLSPDKQLMAIADAMQGVGDAGDKTRLAMKLFDSEGVALLQTMTEGSEGMRTLMKEADDLGLTLNNKTAVGAATANDAINRAKSAMQGAALQAVQNTAPAIAEMANQFSATLPTAVTLAISAFATFKETSAKILSFILDRFSKTAMIIGDFIIRTDSELAASMFRFAKRSGLMSQSFLKIAEDGQRLNSSLSQVTSTIDEMAANPAVETGAAIETMTEGMLRAQEEAQKLGDTMKVDLFDESRNAFQQIGDMWKQTLQDMINAWVSSGIKNLFKSFFNMGGGGGGFLGGIGKLFGFANGGSFEVGGRGGTDSNLVAFRATKGERVTVQTPNQQRQGGGGVVFHNSYDFRGSSLDEPEVRQMIEQSQRVTKRQIQNEMMRGRF